MKKVYLISEDLLKANNINDNVSPEYIDQAIELAQAELEQFIGSCLFDKVCDLVESGEIQDEANKKYKKLLDKYISDYLLMQCQAELTVILGYKYRNAGIIQTNNEHVYNSGMKDVLFMKDYYQDKADFYAIKMKNFIKNNHFQEACGCSCAEIQPTESFDCGIVLDDIDFKKSYINK